MGDTKWNLAENIVFEDENDDNGNNSVNAEESPVLEQKYVDENIQQKAATDLFEAADQWNKSPQIVEEVLSSEKMCFTKESYESSKQTISRIRSEYPMNYTQYPTMLKKLLEFVHVYPILEQRSQVKISNALGKGALALILYGVIDIAVGTYMGAGLIIRTLTFGIAMTAISFCALNGLEAIFSLVSYIKCSEARKLFEKKQEYENQGNCVYKGQDIKGNDIFEVDVKPPFRLKAPDEDITDVADEEFEDAVEKNGIAGAAFYVGRWIVALLLFLMVIHNYDIGIIDFIWFLW